MSLEIKDCRPITLFIGEVLTLNDIKLLIPEAISIEQPIAEVIVNPYGIFYMYKVYVPYKFTISAGTAWAPYGDRQYVYFGEQNLKQFNESVSSFQVLAQDVYYILSYFH